MSHEYPVNVLCATLAVSASGYHAWVPRAPSQRAQANAALLPLIAQAHRESRQTYGSPRITRWLLDHGQPCGRVLQIVDALGQTNTLTYLSDSYQNGTNANFYKISKVTDPWGRQAKFTYNSMPGTDANLLATSTDAGGLVSQFTYTNDSTGFMVAMGTPYGTTTFAKYDFDGTKRWLQATDPLGQTERMEFNQAAYLGGPGEKLPADFQSTTNYYLYRNFFWDKNTMDQMGGVISSNSYSLAHIYHWLHVNGQAICSGTLESEKKPLESRVCYIYPGEGYPYINESTNQNPAVIGRVLDDRTTQTNQYQYNFLGNVTQYTDPSGRITQYIYSTNNIDLLQIFQGPVATPQLLATYTYDPAHPHLPKTVIPPRKLMFDREAGLGMDICRPELLFEIKPDAVAL